MQVRLYLNLQWGRTFITDYISRRPTPPFEILRNIFFCFSGKLFTSFHLIFIDGRQIGHRGQLTLVAPLDLSRVSIEVVYDVQYEAPYACTVLLQLCAYCVHVKNEHLAPKLCTGIYTVITYNKEQRKQKKINRFGFSAVIGFKLNVFTSSVFTSNQSECIFSSIPKWKGYDVHSSGDFCI